jgi:hypothetical protein
MATDAPILHGFPGFVGIPYRGAEAVTPDDSTELTNVSRALYIGGAGNASVLMADGTTVTLTGLLVGHVYQVAVQRVNATSTTATNITSLY